jgi:predicted permease
MSFGYHLGIALADLRFATRQLRRHPVFTATAALTLALGIGANTAIFTAIDRVLLAPLPYANSERLAALNTHWVETGKTSPRVTGPDAVDLRAEARSLDVVSLYGGGGLLGVALGDHSVYSVVTMVDENFTRVFNLWPVAGRLFIDAEANRVALASEAFARTNYGSPKSAVGQVVHVEGQMIEIVGVLPAGFDFPDRTELWEAAPLQPESKSRTAFNYKALVLLKANASFATAQAEFEVISKRLESAYPEDNRSKRLLIVPLKEELVGKTRPTLFMLWGAAAVLLLVTCVNVAHLQLVRSIERSRELAVRCALGSSRMQVIQPVIYESLLVSLLGTALGLALAFPAVRLLLSIAPKELPRASEIHPNAWVLIFALVISVLTALTSSIIPALRASRSNPAEALKNDNAPGMARHGLLSIRDSFVVVEVAASFLLAAGAILLLHNVIALSSREMGYDPRQILIADVDLPAHGDDEIRRAVVQFEHIFGELSAVPGVKNVAGIMGLPTGDYGSNGSYETQGGLLIDPSHPPSSVFSVASPGYFRAMNIPLKKGRDFGVRDTFDTSFVAIVSESLAKQSFADADPVGKQIKCGLDSDNWMTIIGVVGDVRQNSPADNPAPVLYMPMTQHPAYANQIHIVLRTDVSPLALVATVQRVILKVNPFVAMRFTTMNDMLGQSIATERFRAVLVVAFSAVGLLLAMLGIYGTMACTVAHRTFEIGVRMALGANRSDILISVLRRAVLLACFGICLGFGLSLSMTRLIVTLLEGIRPIDPTSLIGSAIILFVTALAAAFVPALKASSVDPRDAMGIK